MGSAKRRRSARAGAAKAMAEPDASFLSRWARRKRAAGAEAKAPGDDRPAAKTVARAVTEPPAAAGGEPTVEPEALPDPDTFTLDMDFTVFMRAGVPEAMRRRALRRLWRLNPVFANLDGLNDYDGDYTDAAMVQKGMKTAYRIGRGYLAGDDEPPEDAPNAPEAPEELAEPPADSPDDTTAIAVAAESREGDALTAAPDPVAPQAADSAPREPARSKARTLRRPARERRWGGPSS